MKIQKVILSNKILICSPVLYREELCKTFTIINPKYRSAKRHGRGKFLPKKHLIYYESSKEGIHIPRGSLTKLERFYKLLKVKCKIQDKTILLKEVNWQFKGTLLKEKGQTAIKKWSKNFGILKAPTGTGKTIMFLWLMANVYKQPTIITVHTKLLLRQWPKRIQIFLGIPIKDIGIIGDNKISIKPVTIALMQTLVKHPKLLNSFGCLCVDETHRASCVTYTEIIDNYYGRYLAGLSATPSRRDGLTNVMKWYVGGIHVSISLEKADLCPCYYKIVVTDFEAKNCFQKQYSTALVELARNQKRNKLIISNVLKYIEFPGVHLIISQNRMHCTKLYKLLPPHLRLLSEILTGKVNEKERNRITKRISQNKLKFVFATDKLIGEGYDEDWFSVGHQTCPISDPNRLIQYIGRIRRTKEGKLYSLWFDYFDAKESILRSGAKKRVMAYDKQGIKEFKNIKGGVCV